MESAAEIPGADPADIRQMVESWQAAGYSRGNIASGVRHYAFHIIPTLAVSRPGSVRLEPASWDRTP